MKRGADHLDRGARLGGYVGSVSSSSISRNSWAAIAIERSPGWSPSAAPGGDIGLIFTNFGSSGSVQTTFRLRLTHRLIFTMVSTYPEFRSIHYGQDPAQFGELWLPDGPQAARAAGTVVIVHGGFWRARYDLSLGRPLAADLARRGYAGWNLEYRRAGAGGGWPATFEDVAAGFDLLAKLPVDTSRVVAIGHSAGGHLAAWAAGRDKLPPGVPGASPRVTPVAVVSQAGVLALADCARDRVGGTAAPDLMGGGPEELPEPYRLADPIAAVPLAATVLCLHSRRDDEVPFGYSERYVEAATRAGGTAVLDETAGDHYTLIDPGTADWQAVVEALPGLVGALQAGADRPQVGEGRPEQRAPQVVSAG
jgi:acetyl esterase/lipase